MRCSRCDTEIPDQAIFCHACGARAAAPRVELPKAAVAARAALAETAPFEPSPLPEAAGRQPTSDWAAPAVPAEPSGWTASSSGAMPGEADEALELRLARRRQWIHFLLILLAAGFSAGAIYFLYVGVQALRGP